MVALINANTITTEEYKDSNSCPIAELELSKGFLIKEHGECVELLVVSTRHSTENVRLIEEFVVRQWLTL